MENKINLIWLGYWIIMILSIIFGKGTEPETALTVSQLGVCLTLWLTKEHLQGRKKNKWNKKK